MKTFSMLFVAALCSSFIYKPLIAGDSKVVSSNQEKAVALLNIIESGDQSAIAYVNPQKYIQHNPSVGDGLAGFGEVLKALPKGSASVDVVRSFQDGDYVITHTDYNFFGPKVGFDVFRFEDGLIVEHWDNLIEKASQANPSGRTQLDGETEVTDLDKTLENKALVASFVDNVLINGKFDTLTQFINDKQYLQHNPQVADGLDGLDEAIKAMAKQGIEMVYTKNHAVFGQGNFVLTISEGKFGKNPVTYYDLFRVDSGKIVEHWDVIEPTLPKEQRKNTNGKFGFDPKFVVEVATFRLKDGVSVPEFSKLDKSVSENHVSKQKGFIKRESEMTKDKYWRVIVHWENSKSADASMESFMQAPSAKAFLDSVDTSTMVMHRFTQL